MNVWDGQFVQHYFPHREEDTRWRTSSYPTEDGLNFAGIDFPTPVSQIGRLERQNPNLAINVFGWENDRVIVHRISEKGGETPRINLMLVKKGENTHYCLVKRLSALLYDQNRHNESKHFCERCLHGYSRRELLERHKPECKGLLKSPTRTEMPKEGENKMAFQNFYKQMKAPYVVYADFECIVKKIHTCEPDNKKSFTVKTEKQEPCGFSYVVVRSDGQTQGPYTYRGEDAVFVFLSWLQDHEKEMREDMANNRPLVMTNEDWRKYRNAAECHICNKSLHKRSLSRLDGGFRPRFGKILRPRPQKMFLQGSKRKIRASPNKKTERCIRSFDQNNPGKMPILRRSASCPKFQRFCERPRSHDRKISRRSAQRMQL